MVAAVQAAGDVEFAVRVSGAVAAPERLQRPALVAAHLCLPSQLPGLPFLRELPVALLRHGLRGFPRQVQPSCTHSSPYGYSRHIFGLLE